MPSICAGTPIHSTPSSHSHLVRPRHPLTLIWQVGIRWPGTPRGTALSLFSYEHTNSLHRVHRRISTEKQDHFFSFQNRLFCSCDSNLTMTCIHSTSCMIHLNFGCTLALKLPNHFSASTDDLANDCARDLNLLPDGFSQRKLCFFPPFAAQDLHQVLREINRGSCTTICDDPRSTIGDVLIDINTTSRPSLEVSNHLSSFSDDAAYVKGGNFSFFFNGCLHDRICSSYRSCGSVGCGDARWNSSWCRGRRLRGLGSYNLVIGRSWITSRVGSSGICRSIRCSWGGGCIFRLGLGSFRV
mmetsp:Transcript_17750/g.37017  ORF Transcript_17750/g.37017 Transcript_17750/m.37017 type:complete len:299 (-) Transcript_17750:373-1269(-)